METGAPDWLVRRIVEEMTEAVIFADREGAVRMWNRGAEAMFGYSADEALGQSLDLIIPERFRVRHWDGYRHVASSEPWSGSPTRSSTRRRRPGSGRIAPWPGTCCASSRTR